MNMCMYKHMYKDRQTYVQHRQTHKQTDTICMEQGNIYNYCDNLARNFCLIGLLNKEEGISLQPNCSANPLSSCVNDPLMCDIPVMVIT